MKKYKKVNDMEVLKAYYDIQNKYNSVGWWADYLPAEYLAKELGTSIYQIRKAYKQLSQKGLIKLEKYPCYFEEYYNGLYDETYPVLYTNTYVITEKGKELFKEK